MFCLQSALHPRVNGLVVSAMLHAQSAKDTGCETADVHLPGAVVNAKRDAVDIHIDFLHIDLDGALGRTAGRSRSPTPYALA